MRGIGAYGCLAFFTEFDCFHIYEHNNLAFVLLVIDSNISDIFFFLNAFLYNSLKSFIVTSDIKRAKLIRRLQKRHGLGTMRASRQGKGLLD